MPDAAPPPPPEDKAKNEAAPPASTKNWGGDNIDMPTFEQILEMDDEEDDREFSRSIVLGFFEQAENTFTDIEVALKTKNLPKLSSLGHFLKGSSATLGLTKVKTSCERIQHFGQKKDQEGVGDEGDEEVCLERIRTTFYALRKDYVVAERILKTFLGIAVPPSVSITDTDAKDTKITVTEIIDTTSPDIKTDTKTSVPDTETDVKTATTNVEDKPTKSEPAPAKEKARTVDSEDAKDRTDTHELQC